MGRFGKLGLLAVACIASSLTAVAISRGAGDSDPTVSACVEPGQAGAMHYLEPDQDCAKLGVPGGFEIEWDQAGALTGQEAAGLQLRIVREKRKADSLGDVGREASEQIQLFQDRYAAFMTTLSNLLKKNSDTASSIIGNLK